jgi:hypothetical protein
MYTSSFYLPFVLEFHIIPAFWYRVLTSNGHLHISSYMVE